MSYLHRILYRDVNKPVMVRVLKVLTGCYHGKTEIQISTQSGLQMAAALFSCYGTNCESAGEQYPNQ